MQTPKIEKFSTLKLVFGKTSAWQTDKNGQIEEKDNIFECHSDISNNHRFTGGRFSSNSFWKNLSDRFWQLDDFKFEGIAAASYLVDAHRFKIWFNPYSFYCSLFNSIIEFNVKNKNKKNDYDDVELSIEENDNQDTSNSKYSNEQEEYPYISDHISKKKDYSKILNSYDFDVNMYEELKKCNELGGWTFNAYTKWNNAVINNKNIFTNLESVFVHEMFHIIWNHINRCEDRSPQLFNIASDYAINQCCDFTKEFSSILISKNNATFFKKLIISVIKYLINTDDKIRKSLQDLDITDKTDFDKLDNSILNKLYRSYMCDTTGYSYTDNYSNKSADFYYRILLETTTFVYFKGVSGYDGHEKWKSKESDQDAENDANSEGNEEGDKGKYQKGCSEGTEKCESNDGNEEGDKTKGKKVSHKKERGLGGREEHKGFEDIEVAAIRSEVKATVKDTLEKSGINPDDPEELKKALSATPGMGILGALITEWFSVKRKNWRQILKKFVTSFVNPINVDYTMSRESRVIPDVFPGKKRERGLDIIIQMDTSGSINYLDWNDFCNQVEEIGRSCDTSSVRVLQVHSVIASDEIVKLQNIKKMRIKETGGTTMALGPEKLKMENNKKPLIIFTDGYIDIFGAKDYNFKIIMFLSRGSSPENKIALEQRGFTVISQDVE